jgi:ubiquinone/menaquinone biosynthesis C-methylase UbiE
LYGIPSFVADYDPAFEDHWEQYAPAVISDEKRRLANAFLTPIRQRLVRSAPLTVLDAGCGEGAHITALAGQFVRGVGLDIALSALLLAASRTGPDWAFVHADMMALPFRGDIFDACYSFGVLGLTPDPRQALSELVRVTKPGGLVGLWFFESRSALVKTGLKMLRRLSRRLGPSGATVVGNLIVPFYGLLPTRSGLSLHNASWRQTREALMSNLTPPHLHFLQSTTVRAWFAELKVEPLQEGDGVAGTLWGRKLAPE